MAYIKAISGYLPEQVLTNEALAGELDFQVELVAKTAGIQSRHVAGPQETAADLAVKAAEILFKEHGIQRECVDFLMFCTQSPDYQMPSTSCVIQRQLGLSHRIGAFDFDLGCSGYVYGLALANSFVESGLAKNVLLLTGDTISKYMHPKDKNRLLFGDAATATLISGDGMAKIGRFELGTDGSGFDQIIIRNGGARHLERTGHTFEDENGDVHYEDYFDMNGEEVFKFTLDCLPGLIQDILQRNQLQQEDVDYYVFHQANRFMLNTLRKVCHISKEKFYVNLLTTGNTTSSTVPLGLLDSIETGAIHHDMKVMVAGFGVGWSWAGTILDF